MTQLKIYKAKIQKQKGHLITWDTAFEYLLGELNAITPTNTATTTKTAKTARVQKNKKSVGHKTTNNSEIYKLDAVKKRIPSESKTAKSRYIPIAVKNEVLDSTNHLCAECNNPAEILHHQVPFSISKSHNSLIPLCNNHHDLIHNQNNSNIDNKYRNYKMITRKKRLVRAMVEK